MQCEWCKKDCDGQIECVIKDVGRFKLCPDCLNHYHSGEYDKINLKGKGK